MIDFLTQNPMYVVLVTILVLWGGMALYLQHIDTRINELAKSIRRLQHNGKNVA
jgi:hypothetical protein